MQSPIHHRQDESNMDESSEAEKMSPLEIASASATPTKTVTFLASAASTGIKKSATKKASRNQSFRNNRVSETTCCLFIRARKNCNCMRQIAPLNSMRAREIIKSMSKAAENDENVFQGWIF